MRVTEQVRRDDCMLYEYVLICIVIVVTASLLIVAHCV